MVKVIGNEKFTCKNPQKGGTFVRCSKIVRRKWMISKVLLVN